MKTRTGLLKIITGSALAAVYLTLVGCETKRSEDVPLGVYPTHTGIAIVGISEDNQQERYLRVWMEARDDQKYAGPISMHPEDREYGVSFSTDGGEYSVLDVLASPLATHHKSGSGDLELFCSEIPSRVYASAYMRGGVPGNSEVVSATSFDAVARRSTAYGGGCCEISPKFDTCED